MRPYPNIPQEKSSIATSKELAKEEKHHARYRPQWHPQSITHDPPWHAFLYFQQSYLQKNIQGYWKHSKIVLLHKKDDPLLLNNYRLIALANTIIVKYIYSTLHVKNSYVTQIKTS